MNRRFIQSYWKKNPLIGALVLLNCLVGTGWLSVFGYRWLEARRLVAAQTEETVRIHAREGGLTQEDARKSYEAALHAKQNKSLNEAELRYLAGRIEAPVPTGRGLFMAKLPYLSALLEAKNLSQAERAKVTPALVRLLETLPSEPYDTTAFITIRLLKKDQSSEATSAVRRLYGLADERRRRTFEDAEKANAGLKVVPQK